MLGLCNPDADTSITEPKMMALNEEVNPLTCAFQLYGLWHYSVVISCFSTESVVKCAHHFVVKFSFYGKTECNSKRRPKASIRQHHRHQ